MIVRMREVAELENLREKNKLNLTCILHLFNHDDKMDILESLEALGLVAKVVSEMGNHMEIDAATCKVLAPYIIEQRLESSSSKDFTRKIQDSGAEIPAGLIASIDRLVLAMHPKFKAKRNGSNTTADKKTNTSKNLMDDTFAQLEGLAGRSKISSTSNGTKRRHESSYEDKRHDRYSSKAEDDGRHRNNYKSQESRYKRPRSRSLPRGRGRHEQNRGAQAASERKLNRKRMTSQERFDLEQLIKSGHAKAEDFPELNPDYEDAINGHVAFEQEEDVDVEVRDERPPFLENESKRALDLSPIRVVRAPDGSLGRASANGSDLVKTVKEMRIAEAREKNNANSSQRNGARPDDPMASMDQGSGNGGINRELPNLAAQASWKREFAKQNQSLGKRTNMTIKEQRESLPVYKFRDKFIEAIKANQLLVVVGETGSGKTTQLTQYLAEAGFANKGMIGCTQPRRVAAISVAKRVSEEVGCRVGEEIGYTVRFDDTSSPATRIKYMTDGMLQREILIDPLVSRYSVIMLDEAHERTVATDVLFGLLLKTIKKRTDLKIIITSATLDAEKFSSFFKNCPVFMIPGRTYPVEINYAKDPVSDYVEECLNTIQEIHLTQPPGDILVFLTGQEEIDTSCEILHERMKKLPANVPELIILPVYAALPLMACLRSLL